MSERVMVAITVEDDMTPVDVEGYVDYQMERAAHPYTDTKYVDLTGDDAVEAAARALYLKEHGTYTFAKEEWAAGKAHNAQWKDRAMVALEAVQTALLGVTS